MWDGSQRITCIFIVSSMNICQLVQNVLGREKRGEIVGQSREHGNIVPK
jgi:hypothetical protein